MSLKSSIRKKVSQISWINIGMTAAESAAFPSSSSSSAPLQSTTNDSTTTTSTTTTNLFSASSVWDLSKVTLKQHVEESKKLLHTEVFSNSLLLPLFLKLPANLRRPVAKMGVRTYSASGEMMDNIISNIYGEDKSNNKNDDSNKLPPSRTTTSTSTYNNNNSYNDNDKDYNDSVPIPRRKGRPVIDASYIRSRSYNPSALPPKGSPSNIPRKFHSVALFVYMWVDPKYRKQNYGDTLLTYAMGMCRERGDEYMLLVHDDDGTDRLVNYYIKRGFVPIFNFIDKGMIYKL